MQTPNTDMAAATDAEQAVANETFISQHYGDLQAFGAADMRPVWAAISRVAQRMIVRVRDGVPSPSDVKEVGGVIVRALTCVVTRSTARFGGVSAIDFRWLKNTPLYAMLPGHGALIEGQVNVLAADLADNIMSEDSDWFWRMVTPDDAEIMRRVGVWPSNRAMPGWPEYLWLAVFAYGGASPDTADGARDAMVQLVTRDTGLSPHDPRCDVHPLVVAILATTKLVREGLPAIIPLLREPEWSAVHGVELSLG